MYATSTPTTPPSAEPLEISLSSFGDVIRRYGLNEDRVYLEMAGGKHAAAFMLRAAIRWAATVTARERGGWFWKSATDWRDECGLTEYQIRKMRDTLPLEHKVEPQRQPDPASSKRGHLITWYRVKFDELKRLFWDTIDRLTGGRLTVVTPPRQHAPRGTQDPRKMIDLESFYEGGTQPTPDPRDMIDLESFYEGGTPQPQSAPQQEPEPPPPPPVREHPVVANLRKRRDRMAAVEIVKHPGTVSERVSDKLQAAYRFHFADLTKRNTVPTLLDYDPDTHTGLIGFTDEDAYRFYATTSRVDNQAVTALIWATKMSQRYELVSIRCVMIDKSLSTNPEETRP